MKKIQSTLVITALTLFLSSSASAHFLWVNLNESFAHPPGHAMACMGWGHSLPLDDFLISEAGKIDIGTYVLIGPDNGRTELALPVIKKEKPTRTQTNLNVFSGDLGLRKIALTENTQPGTYQVVAASKANFLTGYVDKNGKSRMSTKPMDEIRDAQKINFSTRYQAFGKSYMTIGEWSEPPAAQCALEIMPACDLSNVHAGDMLNFEATLNDKKLTCNMHGMNYLFAVSNTYGGPDGFMLASYIMDGRAGIRIPTAGQWMIIAMVQKNVSQENDLKALAEKCRTVHYMATVTLNVKP